MTDTGLLALVARVSAARDCDFAVPDRCDAPLELCHRIARAWSLPIETMRQDLIELDVHERFDIVLVHDMLNFIAAGYHADVLTRLRRVLCRLLFNTSHPGVTEIPSGKRGGYADLDARRIGPVCG